jgi:hypothetical protein
MALYINLRAAYACIISNAFDAGFHLHSFLHQVLKTLIAQAFIF